jgi:hypothetical protein
MGIILLQRLPTYIDLLTAILDISSADLSTVISKLLLPVPGSLDKQGEESAIFYKAKDSIFFRHFLSNEPCTELSL